MNTARRSLTGTPRPAVASLGLGLLGALSGCFNPTPPANVACAPDGWCPSGQTCDTNFWQCVPAGSVPDAGGLPWFDSGPWWPPPDAPYPWPDAGYGEGIEAALAAPEGPVSIGIKQVLVTYIKPATELEPDGFFVQSNLYGPAMFVTMGPDFAGVRLAAGDLVSFRVYYMARMYGSPIAEYIGELVLHSRGNDVSYLVQDVNAAYDLATNVAAYNAELIRASLSIDGAPYEDGYGFIQAPVTTSSMTGPGALQVRFLPALQEQFGFEEGCYFQLYAVPFWRLWDSPVFAVHDFSELENTACPAPRIRTSEADTDTSVQLEFTRRLDADTVAADGSQFTIPGLTVTAAALDGRFVTLTTTPQTAGQLYSIGMDSSMRDILGAGVVAGDADSFVGAAARARVRINELKANITPSCDLLELRVTSGGTLDGVRITEQGVPVHTFRDLQVATNDLVVIHFNSFSTLCNPGRSASETQSVSERPRVIFGANFDTAYDIHTPAVGLDVAPHTITVLDHRSRMLDVALVTDGSGSFPDLASEQDASLAAAAGEWTTQDGFVPPGGFRSAVFREHAAPGLDAEPVSIVNGWSALDGKQSMQRNSDADNNHKGDWTTAPHTFGLLNPGQSPL